MGKNKKKTQQARGKVVPTPTTPVVPELETGEEAGEKVQLAEEVGTSEPFIVGPLDTVEDSSATEGVTAEHGQENEETPTIPNASLIIKDPEDPSTEDDLFGSTTHQEGGIDVFASLGAAKMQQREVIEVPQDATKEDALVSETAQLDTGTTSVSHANGEADVEAVQDDLTRAANSVGESSKNSVQQMDVIEQLPDLGDVEDGTVTAVKAEPTVEEDAPKTEDESPHHAEQSSKHDVESLNQEKGRFNLEATPQKDEDPREQEEQAETADDLFASSAAVPSDPENFFNQTPSAAADQKHPEPFPIAAKSETNAAERSAMEDDAADLFGDAPVQDPLAQEFEIAVELVQVDVKQEEPETTPHGQEKTADDASDLFAGDFEEDLFGAGNANGAEEDLFGPKTGAEDLFASVPENAGKADEVFASSQGNPEEADDLFGDAPATDLDFVTSPAVSESKQAHGNSPDADAHQDSQEQDDLFGEAPATDLDFITSSAVSASKETHGEADAHQDSQEQNDLFGDAPATDLDFITAPPATAEPSQPLKQRVEDMDLDAAGVPQGWVDESGGWNWYTAEERVDVARGMFGDESDETDQVSPVEEEVKHDPYASQTATSDGYNPQQSPYVPSTAYDYVSNPTTSVMQASTSGVYDRYKPSVSTSSPVSAYARPVHTNTYNSYQPKLSGAHVHAPVEPPTRSFSPYDPPVAIVSNPHVYKPAAPVLTASSSYLPPSVVSSMSNRPPPAPALSRMKTSTAYDPPMIPVTKAMSRPASAAAVSQPFAPSAPSGLGINGIGSVHHAPPGVTPPPPVGPPRGPSRIASPANALPYPPARKPQQVPSALAHPTIPNAYDPPALPVMPNRPASRVATPVMTALVSPQSPAAGVLHQSTALPPPPSRTASAMTAPPRAPPRQPPPPAQPARHRRDVASEVPIIQAVPPTPDYESPPPVTSGSPSSLYAPPTHAAYPAPPKISQPPASQRASQPRASPVAPPPLTYGVPAPNYQAPPFSRQSSSVKGVFVSSPSKEAAPAPFPNENHARMHADEAAPTEEAAEPDHNGTKEHESHEEDVTAIEEDAPDAEDPEGGAFDYAEDEGEFADYSVQSVKPRSQLQHDTFAPPSPPTVKAAAPPVHEVSPYDPYAPKHDAPVSAPAYTPVTTSVPIRPASTPYADFAADPYAPQGSLPSQSYMPVSSHPKSLAVPASPIVQANTMPTEPFGYSPGIPPSASAYDPVDASARPDLGDDPLARASSAARRVPSVSFGPNGTLVVAFQRDVGEDTSLQSTSLAYGDDSKGLPVHIRRLADSLPPVAEESGSIPWPGPLLTDPQASKTSAAEKKKRDTLNAFLTERLQEIESGLPYLSASGKDVVTRANQEATMLLYQVAQLMLKHDGKVLTSDPAAQIELRAILPKLSQALTSAQSTVTESATGIGSTTDTHYLSEYLLKGDQQAALQYAMDHQLWSHALLLAAGIDPATWTTTVAAFVKATVQSVGADGSHAVLATAYSIYGHGGPAVVDSIPDSDLPSIWRNSLATIVASSKPNDASYIIALAEKLNKNGLLKATHLCYVLSPMIVAWQQSRPDSPISLIGSAATDQQTEATLISEILEYAIWLRPVAKGTEAFHGVPGLLQYKLNKAATLFATGDVALAKRYCEAIIASLRLRKVPDQATQRIKAQLQNLLSRINGEEFNVSSAKGLPKPKLENLGSWFEGTITKFIAGDEGENAEPKSSGHAKKASSGSAGIGPFSHFSAITPESTPALPSRAMSSFDIPATSSFPPPPILRSGSAMSYRPQPAPKPVTQQRPTSAMAYRGQEHRLSALSQVSTQATDELTTHGTSPAPVPMAEQPSIQKTADRNDDAAEQHPAVEIPTWGQSYTFDDTNQQDSAAEDESNEGSFINPMANFITPAVSAYASAAPTPPAAYTPQVNHNADLQEDDDDLGLGNSSHKKKQAAPPPAPKAGTPTSNYAPPPAKENPVVQAAAEETEKPKESPKSVSGGSWLGRLWGKGGAETPPSGPVRAKLGNESSMYYDKEQKRWVTKGPGGQPEVPKAAPPPPRAAVTPKPAPSTVPSPMQSMPPSSRPASAAPPAFVGAPADGPARSLAATPALAGAPTPPTRPTSTAGDPPLGALGGPPARKAGAAGKKSIRSRYVEIS